MASLAHRPASRPRIATILVAVISLLAAFFVVLPVTQSIAADQKITVGARQVRADGSVVEVGNGGERRLPETLDIDPGPISQSSFEQLTGADKTDEKTGSCYSESSKPGNVYYSGCIYRLTYMEGDASDGKTKRVPIVALKTEIEGSKTKVILTPAYSDSYKQQSNIELYVEGSDISKYVVAEFMATRDFVTVLYDISGTNLDRLRGVNMQSASADNTLYRQFIARGTGGRIDSSIDIKLPRDYEPSFTATNAFNVTTGREESVDFRYSVPLHGDRSTVQWTNRTYDVHAEPSYDITNFTIKVTTTAKTGTQTVTFATGEAPGRGGQKQKLTGVSMGGQAIDFNTNDPATVNFADKTGDRSYTPVAGSSRTVPYGSEVAMITTFTGASPKRTASGDGNGSSNYWLTQLNLNGQLIPVGLPKAFRPNVKNTYYAWEGGRNKDPWNNAYNAYVNDVVDNRWTRPLVNITIQSGPNAGAQVEVYLNNARSEIDSRGLNNYNSMTGADTGSTAEKRSVWAYLFRSKYVIRLRNLPKGENTVLMDWTPDANSWIRNLDSTGFVAADGTPDALTLNVKYKSDPDRDAAEDARGDGYYSVCSNADLGCIGSVKRAALDTNYKVYYRFQNGWGPAATSPIYTRDSNGVDWQQTSGQGTENVPVNGKDSAKGTVAMKYVTVSSPVESPVYACPWYDGWSTYTCRQPSIGGGQVQRLVGKAAPFEFRITHKADITSGAETLKSTVAGQSTPIPEQTGLNVRDDVLVAPSGNVPTLGSGKPFIGYYLYACTGSSCYPVKNVAAAYNCKTSDMGSAPGRQQVIVPGEQIDLSETSVCWQNNSGEQAVNELRFVPASDENYSPLDAGEYRAMLRQIGNNDANGVRQDSLINFFAFRAVPGIKARFTQDWLNKAENQSQTISRSDGSTVTLNRNDDLSVLDTDKSTVAAKKVLSMTLGSEALTALYGQETALKVNLKWKNNGKAVDAAPSGVSATMTLDGLEKHFDTVLTGYGEGRLVPIAVTPSTGQCSVTSIDLTGAGFASAASLKDGATQNLSLVADSTTKPVKNVWDVTIDVNCPSGSLTLNKTFNTRDLEKKSNDGPKTWWDLKATPAGGTALEFTSGEKKSNLTAGDYTLSAAPKAANATKAAPFNDATEWVCTKQGDTTERKITNNQKLPIAGGENWSCDFASTVAELTMLAYIPGDDSAVEAAKWKLTATPKQTTAMAAGRVNVLAADATLEPVSVTGSRVLAEDSTVFTRPGTTYSFTAEGGALYTKTAQYYDEDAYGAYDPAYLTDDSKWVDVLSTGLTMPTDGKKHYIVRFKIEPVFTASLPLTGGTAKDLYLGLGGIFLAAAAAGIYVIKRRRSRLA